MKSSLAVSTPQAAASNVDEHLKTRQFRASALLISLGLLLMASVLLNVGMGAVQIRPAEVVSILLSRVGIDTGVPFAVRQEAVLMAIRLPRVLLGVLVGASLAVSGAAMQGLFRNPLAAPGLLGVSSGAALAATGIIVFGSALPLGVRDPLGAWLLPAAAFAGSLIVTLFVYSIATRGGRTDVGTMLLAGVAINALAGSGTGLLVFVADDAQLRDITFWSLGSLGGITWTRLTAAAPFMLAAMFLLPQLAKGLNAFLLGESEARHLGVDVQVIKLATVFLAAAAVGAAVSVAGIIGFVGLVVPHLIRMVVGPNHHVLLPASLLLGASLLLLADLFARMVVIPAELPIGIVTSLVGGPFFLWLLLQGRQRLGGL
ncbi:MAG: iron chelate uptake ABC transporter family permease subunit [Deinococcota bacterium]